MTEQEIRTEPRSYVDMVSDWIDSHRRALVFLFGAFIALQLAVNAVIGIHMHVHEFASFNGTAVDSVTNTALLIDTTVWLVALYVLLRYEVFADER